MRAALDLGVDLKVVTGTGPDGAITKADVERSVQAPPMEKPQPVPTLPVTPPPTKPVVTLTSKTTADCHAAMRKAIAAAMARSKREIPHYYLATHIDMSRAMAWLQAENLKREEIMTGLRDLVKRTRAGVLRSSEISEATITVTSLGEQGVESVFGVIYPPQVALVGFGKIVERPWAVNGMVGVRPVMMATLAADHRASDGHRGGLFLAAIERLLQEPEKL